LRDPQLRQRASHNRLDPIMNMTHYMQLLAENQPWNLLLFMAVPVILAETVAITELYILFQRATQGALVTLNRLASIAGGIYFSGVFVHLMVNAVIPLTRGGQWRGPADLIAVGFYLSGIVPLLSMALIDLRVIGRDWTHEQRLGWHAGCVALFLVVAHIAMIFGMLDPTVLWSGDAMSHDHPKH
jgi:hypothetical protein